MLPRRATGLSVAAMAGVLVAGFATARADDDEFLPPSASGRVAPLMFGPQIVNPAEEMRPPQTRPTQPAEEGGLTHPWEMPPINVYGHRPLREEDRIGTYDQPRWTADRRFAETRIYVRPEGSLQFEYWFIPTVHRKGPTDFLTQYELEFGLPGRFQLDLYLSPSYSGSGGPTFVNESIELRYALANWDVIWGNPTLYAEYTKQDKGPDQLETKLLLGDELAPRWHWGWDLTFQHDFGERMTNTYESTAGLSYTVRDDRLDVGLEGKLQFFDVRRRRGRLRDNTFIGPSIQYRPISRMHIDVAPLIGLTHESPALQLYLVLGWEF